MDDIKDPIVYESEKKECFDYFKNNNLWSSDKSKLKTKFKNWSLQNHPDKNKSFNKELYGFISQCSNIFSKETDLQKIEKQYGLFSPVKLNKTETQPSKTQPFKDVLNDLFNSSSSESEIISENKIQPTKMENSSEDSQDFLNSLFKTNDSTTDDEDNSNIFAPIEGLFPSNSDSNSDDNSNDNSDDNNSSFLPKLPPNSNKTKLISNESSNSSFLQNLLEQPDVSNVSSNSSFLPNLLEQKKSFNTDDTSNDTSNDMSDDISDDESVPDISLDILLSKNKKSSIKRKKSKCAMKNVKKSSIKRKSPKKSKSLKKRSIKKRSLKRKSPKKSSIKCKSPKKSSIKKRSIKCKSPKKRSLKRKSLKKSSIKRKKRC